MKGLFSKGMGVIAGLVALFGISVGNGTASVADAAGIFQLYWHRPVVLSEKDTVVLADFANSTGDPVFDGTLRQGMAVQLGQSPFLSLISEQRIRHTLRLMGRSADAPLTPDLARDMRAYWNPPGQVPPQHGMDDSPNSSTSSKAI